MYVIDRVALTLNLIASVCLSVCVCSPVILRFESKNDYYQSEGSLSLSLSLSLCGPAQANLCTTSSVWESCAPLRALCITSRLVHKGKSFFFKLRITPTNGSHG